jgi:hypothetical protein
MSRSTSANVYTATFERLAPTAEFEELFAWQDEALAALGETNGDAAIELPTGAGKTVAALIACEEYRERTGRPVAYLTGTKQLTQQVEAEAARLGVPAVAFHGSKQGWSEASKTDYEFGVAVGVMNYWNYFNEAPGVGPAGLLVLDDVHLAEGPLRDFFTVFIPSSDELFVDALTRIRSRFDYYGLVNDLLDGMAPALPAEMLSPLDSLEVAGDVAALLDDQLDEGSPAWWAWRRTRSRAASCCWIVSSRGLTITPWLPPSQTIDHFSRPERRLYLSATVGDVEDLRRRVGAPPAEKITATVPPRQGKRLVAMIGADREQEMEEVVRQARPLVDNARKALWLCARNSTADHIEQALASGEQAGPVWRLEGSNGVADAFATGNSGQLVCAGRYDGMDFPGDSCRVEILPELPVATSDLEEFVSAYLRDAAFAQGRLAQRVAQALGRCNRNEADRAVYLLWDPAFRAAFGNRQGLGLLPAELRDDVFAAVRRPGDGATAIADAIKFLDGVDARPSPPAPSVDKVEAATPAGDEIAGVMCLWEDGFVPAAEHFARVAHATDGAGEMRGFWLAMRALALTLADRRFGDRRAGRRATVAIADAISAGGNNTFFSRLRASQARAAEEDLQDERARNDRLFAAWDAMLDQRRGRQLERWRAALLSDLVGKDHDAVARAVASVGRLLGLAAETPQAKQGEHDVLWQLADPRRLLVFEVKLAPRARKTSIKDVDQAEGAVRAVAADAGEARARGILLTPHDDIAREAAARLDRVRLLRLQSFRELAVELLELMVIYADGWSSDDAEAREACRNAVEPHLPDAAARLWKRTKSGTWLPFR